MEYTNNDELLYDDEAETTEVEKPFFADEFGERIVSDPATDGLAADDDSDLLTEDELVSTTNGATMADDTYDPGMTAAGDPMVASSNEAAFHETLASEHASDQLTDDDLAVEDDDTAKSHDDHSDDKGSLLDRAKDKIRDIREDF